MTVVVKKRLLDLLQDEHKNYYELVSFFLDGDVSNFEKEKKAVSLLTQEFESKDYKESNLPKNFEDIKDWFINDNENVRKSYQDYLVRRNAGGEREYFKNTGQVFEFLIKVSPTKKVDGSWLYSMVNYWNDPVFHDLILIYLEELGLGKAKSNHVCIYDDLLRLLGLDDFETFLEDEYYHNAAIQLALGYAPPEFIPEIIGFNLGYEQLPLHLLITNYELNELGVDSKYFNLHITIDNLDNGHAHKSVKVLENVYKKYRDKDLFMKKVRRGFNLNQGEFKHEVRQFEKSYDNQQAEQIFLMV
ncbi:iron-containing redox enzyme family protein [Acinetobacter haemolyticus]|nr:iron-containing redox enzyme family protein [Acinetobacter haemolyticus]